MKVELTFETTLVFDYTLAVPPVPCVYDHDDPAFSDPGSSAGIDCIDVRCSWGKKSMMATFLQTVLGDTIHEDEPLEAELFKRVEELVTLKDEDNSE